MRGSLHYATDDKAVRRSGRDDALFSGLGMQLQLQLQLQPQPQPQRQLRNAGVPFDFAQGRLLHYATDDKAVCRFGRDWPVIFWGWAISARLCVFRFAGVGGVLYTF